MKAAKSLALVLGLVSGLGLVGCGGSGAKKQPTGTGAATGTSETTTTTIAPKTPREYLTHALDVIHDNGFYADRVDWPSERAKAEGLAAGARTFADTYPAIEQAIKDLGDRHSRFATPDQVQEAKGGLLPEGPPDGKTLAPRIAELHLPVVSGPQESPGSRHYVEAAEGVLRGSLDACGWVLDLRGNPGGNLVPIMLAAAPLLGEGDAVIVRDHDGKPRAFSYQNRKVSYDGRVIKGVEGTLAPLSPPPPVAVLTDGDTASSAEFLLLAFRDRPQTRTFGTETVGLTGGNGVFPMADGAQIVLTISVAEDLRGHRYDGPIPPDEQVDPTDAEAAAVGWLRAQPACAL